MAWYLAIEPVRHDGQRLAPGSRVELEDAEATPLLALRVIQPEDAKTLNVERFEPAAGKTDSADRSAAPAKPKRGAA